MENMIHAGAQRLCVKCYDLTGRPGEDTIHDFHSFTPNRTLCISRDDTHIESPHRNARHTCEMRKRSQDGMLGGQSNDDTWASINVFIDIASHYEASFWQCST